MLTSRICTKYLQHVLHVLSLQLKPRLDMVLPTRYTQHEMEHEQEPEEFGDQSPAPESSTSKGKSCTLRGRHVPSKSSTAQKKTSTPAPAQDDTAEVANLISSLQSQQERSDAIQGQITGLMSREQRSATAAWGTWFGAMAANLDPALLPRFYRASFDMVLSFAEESRQLQIAHAGQQFVPMIFDEQPLQKSQQSQHQQQQHHQTTFTTLLTPVQHQQQHHQQQHTFFDGARATPMWDTMGLTTEKNVASMSTSYPPRAASTPASLNSTFQLPISPDITNLNTSPSPARRQPDATFN